MPSLKQVVLLALFLCPAARAWDAGPSSCKHSECSGAVVPQLMTETDCGKYGRKGAAKTRARLEVFQVGGARALHASGAAARSADRQPCVKRIL